MTTRYWAPSSTERPLDDVVLSMLQPGEDAQKDLGLHLLAAHRAGAAAVQEVAKRSLVSEDGIIGALAGIREQIADRMVDAIAVHHDPVYSALLVRDFFDDAEDGALTLYRSAVAKGVSPPVAAERASHAFGMPMRQMGSYASLAMDPKTPPRAIEDSADRALLEYVSKAAAAEEPKSVVSKAGERPMTVMERIEFEREHPRAPDGRFTHKPEEPAAVAAKSPLQRVRERLGLAQGAPTQVADEPTRDREKTRERHKSRQTKIQRQTRQARSAQLVRTGAKRAQDTPRVQEAPSLKRREQAKTHTRRQLQTVARAVNRGTIDTSKGKPKGMPVPDVLRRLPADGMPHYDIGQSVIIGTSSARSGSFRTTMSDQAMSQKDPSRRIFRMGHLLNLGTYTETSGVAERAAHVYLAENELNHHSNRDDFISPEVAEIVHAELGESPRDDSIYIENRRKKMAERTVRMPNGDARRVVDHEELQHIYALPIYTPYGEDNYDEDDRPIFPHGAMAIVHYRPADPSNPTHRPMPSVDEYIIDTEARGTIEGSRHEQVILDPNKVYEVVNAPDVSPMHRVKPEQYYDVDNEVIVNRWFLQPLDDDDISDIIDGVEKAYDGPLTVMERVEFNRKHPRDSDGRFRDKPDEAPVSTPVRDRQKQFERVQQRQKRIQRQERQQRATRMVRRVEPAQSSPSLQPRVNQRRQTQVRTPIAQALDRAHARQMKQRKTLADMVTLSDASAYKVLTENDFQLLVEGLGETGFRRLHSGKTVYIDAVTKERFATAAETQPSNIPQKMAYNIDNVATEEKIEAEVVDIITTGAEVDFDHVADRIMAVLDKFPETDLLELMAYEDGIYIYARSASATVQNLIEYDPELNFDQPLVMTYLGERRARDIQAPWLLGEDVEHSTLMGNLSRLNYDHEGAVPNPKVHHYKLMTVTQPRINRFRVDNE